MNRDFDIYKRRYARARSLAMQWWPLLQACYHYCIPNRNLYYYTNQTQGSQKNIQVYDTTQVAATRAFVSKLQEALCPPQTTWALLEAGSFVPDDHRESINQQLQEITDILFSYIRGSNFDLVINESFYDLATGTGILVIQPGPSDNDPVVYGSIPLEQVAIEESISGRAESCYRTWGEVRILDIQIVWPKARLTQSMQQNLKENPAATVKDLVEAVIHNPKDKLPYTYCLWHGDEMLLEEKMVESPFVIFRMSKINNEVFGRGPIIDALPSIISLQTVAYYELTAANLNICKPYMGYSDGIFNPWTFELRPNTIIPVSPTAGGQFPLQPLPDVANPAFMQLVSQDLRMQINKLMYSDPLGPVDAPARTATEIAVRQQNLAEIIGPSFTRLQMEFMNPTITKTIHILQDRGLLPRLEIDGKEIAIRYKSPLTISQGQKNVQTFLQYQQIMQGTVGQGEAAMYLKPDYVHVWLAEQLGMNLKLINSQEEMSQMLAAQSEKQQMMEMGAMNGAMGQSLPAAA